MNLYVNGVLDGTATQNRSFVAPVQATLTIGVRGEENGEFFDGLLDEIRVFGVTLSPEDVLTLVGVGRNDDAVAGQLSTDSTAPAWEWTELYDQTGASEDMSFMLFTEPVPCDSSKTTDDGDDDKKDTTTGGDSKDKN